MISTITDEIEINKYQTKLSEILKEKLPLRGKFKFGDPGYTFIHDIYHNNNIWWHSQRWEGKSGPCHVNLFGFWPLFKNTTNAIDLTINIPIKDINRRYTGLFAKNSFNDEILVIHRGKFHRRKKEDFRDFFNGKLVEVFDDDRTEILFYVMNLNNLNIAIDNITFFLKEVMNFKKTFQSKK
jgi:hypothetical protein